MKVLDWYNLYGGSWNGKIIPEAYAHPAKFSALLIEEIYDYLMAEGLLKAGSTVVDPFGGVGLGAEGAARRGVNWKGVELEPRFVALGQGMDCPGFTADDWRRMAGRPGRFSHLCPHCQKKLELSPPERNIPAEWGERRRRLAEIYGRRSTAVDLLMGKPEAITPLPLPDGRWRPLRQLSLFADFEQRPIPTQLPHRFRGNIDRWMDDPAYTGRAILLQGDSRKLAEIIAGADTAVSSPPYNDVMSNQGHGIDWSKVKKDYPGRKIHAGRIAMHDRHHSNLNYGDNSGQLGSMPSGSLEAAVSSPPFGAGETRNRSSYQGGFVADMMSRAYTQDKQGDNPRNLAMLDATVSSPPYAGSLESRGDGIDWEKTTAVHRGSRSPGRGAIADGYGETEGQLGSMVEGRLDVALSSPPYGDAVSGGEGPGVRHDPVYHKGDNARKLSSQPEYGRMPGQLGHMDATVSSPPYADQPTQNGGELTRWPGKRRVGVSQNGNDGYGESPGQLAAMVVDGDGETFWSAARLIVDQVYQVLKPGGTAVWVCKDFIRDKQRVPFSAQWLQLCQMCGFEPVAWVRSWLTEETSTIDLWGEWEVSTVKRASFFRRLLERNANAERYFSGLEEGQRVIYREQGERLLLQEHQETLIEYRVALAAGADVDLPTPPTAAKINRQAALLAWDEAGRPLQDIETGIDWEDVLILRKF